VQPMMFSLTVLLVPSIVAWQAKTVFDVLPEDCRSSIGNNDVGNPRGDMYFNLKDKYLPVACEACLSDPQSCQHNPATFDCTNPESSGNLVVRKIAIEVTGYDDDDYKLCDVWPGNKPCEYTCFGHSKLPTKAVGREPVCGGDHATCDMAPAPIPDDPRGMNKSWDYWNYNIATLMGNTGGGEWYSLQSSDKSKYWRNATVVKMINAKCQARALETLVQTTGAACFGGCPQPTNQSTACWIDCFFSTVLGPDADTTLKPPGNQTGAMSLAELETAWLAGFASDDESKGGCPPCPATGPCPDSGLVAAEDAATKSATRYAPRRHSPS